MLLPHSLYQLTIPTSLRLSLHIPYLFTIKLLTLSTFQNISAPFIPVTHAALAWKLITIHSVNVKSLDWSSYLQCGCPFNSLSTQSPESSSSNAGCIYGCYMEPVLLYMRNSGSKCGFEQSEPHSIC